MANNSFITTGERTRNFLAAAFIFSIIIHALVSPFFPNLNRHKTDEEVEKVSVTKKIVVKVPTPPPPTPTPPPSPTPPPQKTPPPKVQKQVVQPKLKVNVPKTSNNSSTSTNEQQYNATKGGSENGVPGGADKGTPGAPATPAPTAKPACANPNQDATVTNAMAPDYPDSARDLGLGPVTVLVEVTVSPSGSLTDASVYKSSGNGAIDREALRAAHQSTYAPKLVNCSPTSGQYLFRAEFNPD